MKHLLVVEDNRIAGSLISSKVSGVLPVTVHWAQSMGEALRLLDEHNNDFFAALLDYMLPDAPDGEIIDEVVARGVPSIVFTGNVVSEKDRRRLWRKQIVDYVIKDDPQSLEYITFLLSRLEKNAAIKILIVDDSRFFRVVLGRLLRVHQYEVLEAVDGEDGLKQLEAHRDIRLVVTDYNMPGMDGFAFIKRLRKLYGRETIAVLGLASERNRTMGARFIKCGANDFISKKSFIAEELYCRVNQNLESLERLQTIRRLATTDPLTHLYNRRYFYDTATHLVASARRNGTPLACAVLDVDRFKKINDTWGHETGDRALQHIAGILVDHFQRSSDLVARMGGEEFCVLTSGLSAAEARKRFESVRRKLEQNLFELADGETESITASIGLCCQNVGNLDALLRRADELLYNAKRTGRNRVCSDSEAGGDQGKG
jgi:diguanylate cyclase (GGDEF)-like protein